MTTGRHRAPPLGFLFHLANPLVATVYLTSATIENDPRFPWGRQNYDNLRVSAERDRFGVHTLADDPAGADLIIFVEIRGSGLYFERVRRHPLVKRYREKCFLVCEMDYIVPFLPGVYASIEQRWASPRVRSGHYLRTLGHAHIQHTPLPDGAPYLFSFVGSTKTSPLRRRLAALEHPRGFFLDTAGQAEAARGKPEAKARFQAQYAETNEKSVFILCPRGLGASSMRLFETMEMGRVPVIISDDWLPPEGPEWERFSVRVPEAEVERIPELLERLEPQAPAMAALARETWEAWFSEEASFHRIVEWCLSIQRERTVPERFARFGAYVQLLRPFHFKHFTRQKLSTLLGKD